MNPDKQEKLRAEIMQILPTHSTPLSQATLSKVPYFMACLKETMRLSPIVPGNVRAIGKNIVLNGYQIPENVYKSEIV